MSLISNLKPTIIIIPGSFTLPEFYKDIVDEVVANGLEIRTLHLPTFVADEVTRLADSSKDVALVTHSYGGVSGTQVGETATDVLATVPKEQQSEILVDEKGWLCHANYTSSAKLSFLDVPPLKVGEAWVAKFARQSSPSFVTPPTYPGYCDVPVSYLVCENDLVIPKELQEAEIAMIEEASGNKVNVSSIKAGHIPILSMPQAAVDWITQTAETA